MSKSNNYKILWMSDKTSNLRSEAFVENLLRTSADTVYTEMLLKFSKYN